MRQLTFLLGLLLTAAATLVLEILDTRLLSVITWYHLSFFAVSAAMFGMAAGAVHVYLGGARFEGEAARRQLVRHALAFAVSVPVTHALNLSIPIRAEVSLMGVSALVLSTLALAVPFYLSGIVVSVALTRVQGPVGRIYAADLVGAALGCLAVVGLLDLTDVSSVALVSAAIAAAGAACFERFAGLRPWRGGLLALGLLAAAFANHAAPAGLHVLYAKGNAYPDAVVFEAWNVHSQVIVQEAREGSPPYWAPGRGAGRHRAVTLPMVIDGSATTAMTRWGGDPDDLDWVAHDVTSLLYHLRPGGEVAVIGVGGGRDILTALWAGARRVTGIEINDIFLHLLEDRYRDFASLGGRDDVELVHDEARSYLTRVDQRFDVLQMSLIDTWAATGAGAFTLSENGLYTLEAWKVFLDALEPGGMFAVSRWYSPRDASETSRLLSLATAALIERGVDRPRAHLALAARDRVATLLLSTDPLTGRDLERLDATAARYGFEVLVAPGRPPALPLFGRILAAGSLEQLDAAVRAYPYDYTPPRDERPYFFNILKLSRVFDADLSRLTAYFTPGGGVIAVGNLLATVTLLVLFGVALALVAGVILWPLWRSGLPRLDRRGFAWSLLYFAAIGLGYMLIQIPLVQRFSVYLGHPVYAVAVILFSMILATGIGSAFSDRVPVEARPVWLRVYPAVIVVLLLAVTAAIQPVFDATVEGSLLARCATVVALVTPLSFTLGLCFPIGLRLVRRIAPDALPWMWGVNGACGVLASVAAVGVSISAGIHANLYAAAALYASLLLAAPALWRRG